MPDISPEPTPQRHETSEPPKRGMHPVTALIFGICTFAYLAWTAYAAHALIAAGIPDTDRAHLAGTFVMSGVGIVITAIGGAAAVGTQNPLSVLASMASSIRAIVRR